MAEERDAGPLRKAVEKAARTGAAYGALAAGAYGTYTVVPQPTACAQEEQEEDTFVWDWSDTKEYEAQTRFLKVIYSVHDGGNGRTALVAKAIDETYAKAREDLGKALDGKMDEKVTSVEILEDGALRLTLTFEPTMATERNLGASKVRVRYRIARFEVKRGRAMKQMPDVKILGMDGHYRDQEEWRELPIPDGAQPTLKKEEDADKPVDCSYPRWNPRSTRYGFFSRETLGEWYR